MQQFMDTYPDSDRIDDANKVVQELRYKKETKAFNTAYQYYHIEDYTAAIASFDNLIGDYLGTKYREQALYLKFDAAYLLGIGSVPSKKEKRINTALEYLEKFEKKYPESEFLKNSDKKVEKLNKELVAVQEMAASILN